MKDSVKTAAIIIAIIIFLAMSYAAYLYLCERSERTGYAKGFDDGIKQCVGSKPSPRPAPWRKPR